MSRAPSRAGDERWDAELAGSSPAGSPAGASGAGPRVPDVPGQGIWGAGEWRAWCVLVGALLQLGFLAELVLPGEPDWLRSQISELSAPGQAGAGWFRAADIVTGLLVLVVVPDWWRASRTVGACLATWGLGLALAAVTPATCANSLHPGCDGSGLPGLHTDMQDNLHDIGSIASVLAVLLGIVVAGRVLARAGHLRRGRLVLALGLSACALGLFESGEDVLGVTGGRGVSQRLQVLVLSCALVVLADPRRWPFAGRPGRPARLPVTPPARSPSGR